VGGSRCSAKALLRCHDFAAIGAQSHGKVSHDRGEPLLRRALKPSTLFCAFLNPAQRIVEREHRLCRPALPCLASLQRVMRSTLGLLAGCYAWPSSCSQPLNRPALSDRFGRKPVINLLRENRLGAGPWACFRLHRVARLARPPALAAAASAVAPPALNRWGERRHRRHRRGPCGRHQARPASGPGLRADRCGLRFGFMPRSGAGRGIGGKSTSACRCSVAVSVADPHLVVWW